MHIKQFEDKNLAHYSYAILDKTEKKLVLVDPARDTQPYLDYAKETGAQIAAVIETHPHADFVSSHLELQQATGCTLYVSKAVEAAYRHQPFDDGQVFALGTTSFTAMNTPGHSPDSISILLKADGQQKAVFTGDTLFIGDCGRPDLRPGEGNAKDEAIKLAGQMYHSLREKLMVLHDDVLVYPAHGAGTLCGKNLSKESSSTIGREKFSNWSLQDATEQEFVQSLLTDQPFVPRYFSFDVELNRKGAASLAETAKQIVITSDWDAMQPEPELWVVDTRPESAFKEGHLPHAVNLMENGKFETWLGSIIKPGEQFYLVAENKAAVSAMVKRAGSIGYETFIRAAFAGNPGQVKEAEIDLDVFRNHPGAYSIIDVRNNSEVKEGKIFPNSIPIPLDELISRVNEIPVDKPIVVHCAGGYRSAAASSILHAKLNGAVKVFDLGEAVNEFASL